MSSERRGGVQFQYSWRLYPVETRSTGSSKQSNFASHSHRPEGSGALDEWPGVLPLEAARRQW